METIYEWLYDYHAEPQLRNLPEFSKEYLEQLADAVPGLTRVGLLDRLETLRLDCGTAAFTAGVQLGMDLLAPRVWQREPALSQGDYRSK